MFYAGIPKIKNFTSIFNLQMKISQDSLCGALKFFDSYMPCNSECSPPIQNSTVWYKSIVFWPKNAVKIAYLPRFRCKNLYFWCRSYKKMSFFNTLTWSKEILIVPPRVWCPAFFHYFPWYNWKIGVWHLTLNIFEGELTQSCEDEVIYIHITHNGFMHSTCFCSVLKYFEIKYSTSYSFTSSSRDSSMSNPIASLLLTPPHDLQRNFSWYRIS